MGTKIFSSNQSGEMKKPLCIILGGGKGTRLFPLTEHRSKPAVPLGGKYRLIDIPVSNCLNSGLGKIYVITQFNSVSLHRHIEGTYRFDHFSRNFVEILAAQQTPESSVWYQGTADAVRQNLRYINSPEHDPIVILSGDQLYRMDYRKMIDWHNTNNADLTVAVIPVERERAKSFGVLQIDDDCVIRRFVEKPQQGELLDDLVLPKGSLDRFNINAHGKSHLASMGIYVFNREVLVKLLDNEHTDFGKEIIPHAFGEYKALAYPFSGYWEDIGTIRSFFEANLALTDVVPAFDFYSFPEPIFTRPRQLPASKFQQCQIHASVIADGCILEWAGIHHCMIGIRSFIRKNTTLRDTVMMGSDFYEAAADFQSNLDSNLPHVGIGESCEVREVIIDKNARIGNNCRIFNKDRVQEADGDCFYIREGIVCIPKDAVVPPGTEI